MNITLKRTVNLSEPILPEVLSAPLYEGEKNAHTFMITAEKDKLPYALSGSVVAYFERNDGNTVRVEGETKDGAAILTLSPECYQTGVFYLAVMLISDGAQTVIYAASGRVRNTQEGEIINGGDAMPTYEEILAHLNKYLNANVSAKVVETAYGAEIITSDAENGETRAKVYNGKDGPPGKDGDTQVFLVHDDIDGNSDKTKEEVLQAVADGKLVVLISVFANKQMLYSGRGKHPNLGDEICPIFTYYIADAGLLWKAYLKSDQTFLLVQYDIPTGGSDEIAESDIFTVKITKKTTGTSTTYTSDRTVEEIRAAIAAKKTAVLLDNEGRVFTYYGEKPLQSGSSTTYPRFAAVGEYTSGEGLKIDYYTISLVKTAIRSSVTVPTGGTGGSNLPETTDPLKMLVTDLDGNAVWEDRPFYKYVKVTPILPETTITGIQEDPDSEMLTFNIGTPFVLEAGKTYAITYNGETHDCQPLLVEETEEITAAYIGNLGAMDESLPDTGEPFVIVSSQGVAIDEVQGAYGVLVSLDGSSEVTVSIDFVEKTVKKIDEEDLPESALTPKITITAEEVDGETIYTADYPFDKAWEMSAAQLQSAITLEIVNNTNGAIPRGKAAASLVSKTEMGTAKLITIHFRMYSDANFNSIFALENFMWQKVTESPDDMIARINRFEVPNVRYIPTLIEGEGLVAPIGEGNSPTGKLELKTMSETEKGGAKVGEGLEVVGEKLRVKPEGEYELIETITVEEEVNTINRSLEPDGTAYNFKKLYIKTHTKPAQTATALSYSVVDMQCRIAMNHINTTDTFAITELKIESGKFKADCSYGFSGEYAASAIYTESYHAAMWDLDAIKKLDLIASGGLTIPSGSTFEIWGVRA